MDHGTVLGEDEPVAAGPPTPPASGRDAAAARPVDALALATLRENWRSGEQRGVRYGYTCPSTPRYRHQWHWDSCFSAIAWARFDPARAREELRTVLRSGDPRIAPRVGARPGLLPHTVFWDRPAGWRRAPFYATRSPRGDLATASIGPPLLPLAWERVAAADLAGDPGFGSEALPGLAEHLDWLAAERDLAGDGLLTILFPDESGLDDSPQYDLPFRRVTHDGPGYWLLVERARRVGYDARRFAARHDHHVVDVWTSTAYALSLHAMARLSGDRAWATLAARTERSLVEHCWDESAGLFRDLAGRGRRPVVANGWSSISPLVLPGIPEPIRRRLAEEQLLDPRRFGAPVGIPSVAVDDRAHEPRFDRWRTWRGPSWINVAWLLLPTVAALGHHDHAASVAGALVAAVEREGLREYYDPRHGRGYGARGFAWSALACDLADLADGSSAEPPAPIGEGPRWA
ncbi:hypothetical protein PAI11_22940 [Patulibacter medicamentivorans]|uniref:Mannosylglycerate hydrolase MGH1-like glycoside hydrolase domain-containing protein n=1 Tax=Patulibacter medicamentivorans TaxID=1097667 RepID=H0E644_9ACTN|nr:hypothetical protein [Patulibacter medicamentivorans]EHN10813.1 hypothetical protein PAI11_22940 [Patulibacter medicamentivorans]